MRGIKSQNTEERESEAKAKRRRDVHEVCPSPVVFSQALATDSSYYGLSSHQLVVWLLLGEVPEKDS